MGTRPELLFDARSIVGESVVYDERGDALFWVDILGRRIHRLGLGNGAHRIWDTPDCPTSLGLRRDGGAVVGLRQSVTLWDFAADFPILAVPEPDKAGNRLNEGRVAPDGSFWVGTMAANFDEAGNATAMAGSTGALYRIAPDGGVRQLTAAEYGITNTMAWRSDGTFLTADTLANTLFTFDHDPATGALSNRRVFSEGFERGFPDGSCLDRDGFLWNCRVAGGACLARYAPDGRLDRVVELPCSWPTSCAFGGPDLAMLFVTSARFTMTSAHLAENPQEGGLFALDVGVRGWPENRFG